jgi:phosphomevalonate kinase
MKVRASAPGKLVVLGEYAVLAGAEALVAAVNRRCVVEIDESAAAQSQLEIRAPQPRIIGFEPGRSCGLELVDITRLGSRGIRETRALQAVLDSSAFFAQSGKKLGMGSSAAVLTALAGALQVFEKKEVSELSLERLIALHRELQGGSGSGIDVAAALRGGLNTFQVTTDGQACAGSVRLPNSVGFAGIFAGKSAITSDFVARFHDWRRIEPEQAAALLAELGSVSAAGCDALRRGDPDGFLAAVGEYGVLLDALGAALRCEVWTQEHRQIAALADEFAVTYKTSGAGGGDLGIAFSQDAEALAALQAAASAQGFLWVDLAVDAAGLLVEELTE